MTLIAGKIKGVRLSHCKADDRLFLDDGAEINLFSVPVAYGTPKGSYGKRVRRFLSLGLPMENRQTLTWLVKVPIIARKPEREK